MTIYFDFVYTVHNFGIVILLKRVKISEVSRHDWLTRRVINVADKCEIEHCDVGILVRVFSPEWSIKIKLCTGSNQVIYLTERKNSDTSNYYFKVRSLRGGACDDLRSVAVLKSHSHGQRGSVHTIRKSVLYKTESREGRWRISR